MDLHPSNHAESDELIAAIRRAVDANDGKWVSLRDFLETPGMTHAKVFNQYPRWEDAMRAAGFEFRMPNSRIPQELLLADWGTVMRALQKIPSKSEHRVRGKYCPATLLNHFGTWHAVQSAFLKFAANKPEWNDVRTLISSFKENTGRNSIRVCRHKKNEPTQLSYSKNRSWKSRSRRSPTSPTYGALLDSGALRHAPVNESGVILLFGMLAERLGFIVDAVRVNFPDCEAIRKTGTDRWERVRIEFEYESRNFKTHKHDPAGCDLIVCWTHNWPECPVEVMALRKENTGVRFLTTKDTKSTKG